MTTVKRVSGDLILQTVAPNSTVTITTDNVVLGGHLQVGTALQLPVYADNAARDAAIPSPSAGQMIFNSTGAKFQGYSGSAWIDLN